MVKYSSEVIGYDSFTDDKQPIWKTLNVNEIQKIHSRTSLNWSDSIPVAKWSASVDPLLKYLQDKGLIHSNNEKEVSIICRGNVLYQMFFKYQTVCSKFKFIKENNVIILEEMLHDNETELSQKVTISTDFDRIAETQLTLLPSGQLQQVHEENNLYLICKHRYEFEDETVINLFISSKVDAVYYNIKTDLVPCQITMVPVHALSSSAEFENYFKPVFIKDFLSLGLTYLFLIYEKEKQCFEKLTLMEHIGSHRNSRHLQLFKSELPNLLKKLSTLNEGMNFLEKTRKENNVQLLCGDSTLLMQNTAIFKASTANGVEFKIDSNSAHELVVLGTHMVPLPYDKPLYNADFITMDHFVKRYYKEIMRRPKKIIFIGLWQEFEKLLNYTSSDEHKILQFVNGCTP